MVIAHYWAQVWGSDSVVKFGVFHFQIRSRIYLPSVSFSPESGGNVKPSRAIDDISTHGTIKLKK